MKGGCLWSCPPLQADGRVLSSFRGGQITGDGLMCQRNRVFRFLSINTT